nr:immunoglobulin light chain junction region [Macaca mulatta]MOX28121.1 immunoglobulin light chain junction region [Macaca mulatta]MOX28169.1 immunoglobulin light chain junction region [Macaca mulatta]MOX28212.1 immunoglobulin light chain junction region [Macaca mulatta]MOX28270.1 immunoglobulin light chain junction region [Macaca mulatta]
DYYCQSYDTGSSWVF